MEEFNIIDKLPPSNYHATVENVKEISGANVGQQQMVSSVERTEN
jgi:hypothetical protein